MTKQVQQISPAGRDGGRASHERALSAAAAATSEYDPDWAICPDGGSNERKDYERHFPTCDGHKCLYSCDAAWKYFDGGESPFEYFYEITVRSGSSGEVLTDALYDMEERMLVDMAATLGIEDCVCNTISSENRAARAGGAGRRLRASVRSHRGRELQHDELPEDQQVINLSNFRRDEILGGKCQETELSEGQVCLRIAGHMDFVHTIEDEATRRLSYEGAMHELHTILAEGMITGEYINQDVPEEERIILGTTFVPSASYGPKWGDAEAWKMPGTVGPNSEITLVAPGGVSGVTGPDGRPKGINYSFVGIFVAIALLTLFIVGIVAVRRRRAGAETEREDGMEEIEKEIGEDGLLAQNEEMMADIMDESAEDSSIDAANDTPFPQEEHFEPAFDLAPVNEGPVAPSMDEGSPVSPSISDDRTEQINNSMQSSDLGPMA